MTTIAIEFDDAKAAALRAEAARRNMSVEDLLRQKIESSTPDASTRRDSKFSSSSFDDYLKMIPADFVPPSDEKIAELLHERRMRHVLP